MYSIGMNLIFGLRQLFEIMDGIQPIGKGRNTAAKNDQLSLFEPLDQTIFTKTENEDYLTITRLHSEGGPDLSTLPANACRLYELSVNAFDTIVYAWISELPITAEVIRFGRKILAAADKAKGQEMAERKAAEVAFADRGDSDARAVHATAYKVWHEIHRLTGLLRFHPDEGGVYTAHCGPDHFILPALGPHFRDRFGETPWAIIDEKRRLCLRCHSGQLEFFGMPNFSEALRDDAPSIEGAPSSEGDWGDLWRLYHKTINNESRKNPGLQKQFMPKRYWKYLTEV
jgi:probable DNA metabolism protein